MYRRLFWDGNRTPVRLGIEFTLRALNGGEAHCRRSAGQAIETDPHVLDVAGGLRQNGFVRVDHLISVSTREALAKAASVAAAAPKPGSSVFGSLKDDWTSIVDSQMVAEQLPSDHVFTRLALEPQIVTLVANYYGELTRLDYVTVTHSLPTDNELSFSQLWHLDYDDTRVVKLLVCLTDFEREANGPFSFLPAVPSRAVGAGIKRHRPDAAIGQAIEERVCMTGPHLSCYMIETSRCYHMGSSVTKGHERVMITATYNSNPRIFSEGAVNFLPAASNYSGTDQLLLFPGRTAR